MFGERQVTGQDHFPQQQGATLREIDRQSCAGATGALRHVLSSGTREAAIRTRVGVSRRRKRSTTPWTMCLCTCVPDIADRCPACFVSGGSFEKSLRLSDGLGEADDSSAACIDAVRRKCARKLTHLCYDGNCHMTALVWALSIPG